MKDAIGGALTLPLIITFMIIVNAYLAFNVNYTKAFRVKNEIRSIIEKHEGLTCEAINDIGDYMNSVNYTTSKSFQKWCGDNGYNIITANGRAFCIQAHPVDVNGDQQLNSRYKGAYYSIVTFVEMDIPILDKFLVTPAGSLFAVRGETSIIYSSGTYTELSSMPSCN